MKELQADMTQPIVRRKICPGRLNNPCGEAFEANRSQKFCLKCRDKAAIERNRRYANSLKGREKNLQLSRNWQDSHREEISVTAHHRFIFRPATELMGRSYNGMPFFSEWNPDLGGSFRAGADWIKANIGPRPDNHYQLHIIDRSIGFVPGNLMWVAVGSAHKKEEIVAKMGLEIKRLKAQLESLSV